MSANEPFDFISHARTAADAYREMQPSYDRYSRIVRDILRASLPSDCPIQSIEARAKSPESVERKARKPADDEPASPKYAKPLVDITDLAAVRVITFFPKTLALVNDCIEREFDVIWKRDIGSDRFEQGRFGYRSVHYLVKLTIARADLPEYSKCRGLVAEIQLRTVLQHAWAEMEHDIQYKSLEQSPASIQRRFIALAGMLEIADREFQAIQDEDASIRSVIHASLEDDLTKTRLVTLESSPTALDTTIEESAREVAEALRNLVGWSAKSVRDLIAAQRFDDAIDLYTRMIDTQPASYTLYVGRAKAKFLAGNRTGALADMDIAEAHLPNDASLPTIRRQIEDGIVFSAGSTIDMWHLVRDGDERLEAGDGEESFALYSRAQQLGFNLAFATFNKAMACVLSKDTDGASYFVDQLTILPGTPMGLNILCLRSIIAVIAKRSSPSLVKRLEAERKESPWYDYGRSPLRHLERGLLARDTTVTPQLARIFVVMKAAGDLATVASGG
jgi:ppGpp synthetase/RelA/SpoT-type nucleotidyltranferase